MHLTLLTHMILIYKAWLWVLIGKDNFNSQDLLMHGMNSDNMSSNRRNKYNKYIPGIKTKVARYCHQLRLVKCLVAWCRLQMANKSWIVEISAKASIRENFHLMKITCIYAIALMAPLFVSSYNDNSTKRLYCIHIHIIQLMICFVNC